MYKDRRLDFLAVPRHSFRWLPAAAAIVMLVFGSYLFFENVEPAESTSTDAG